METLTGGAQMALLVTVAVVVLVNGVLDFKKQMQFRALNAANSGGDVTVTRGGGKHEVDMKDLVVGDVVHIDYGQAIPCDGAPHPTPHTPLHHDASCPPIH